jgi:hypothetical protein
MNFRKPYTVKRMSGGTRVEGKWIPGTYSDITVTMSVQPVIGRELESINIGRQNLGKVKCYTDDELQISEPKKDYTGDIVIFQGDWYEIIARQPWQSGLINHFKYFGEFRKKG